MGCGKGTGCRGEVELRMVRILLQTTIAKTADDWSVERFSLLADLLRSHKNPNGESAFEVTARNRESQGSEDPILSTIDRSDFGQLWLFAVDEGQGLTPKDCDAVSRFRASGRGLMVARDHMDLGCSVCNLTGVGKAHYFHTHNLDPDVGRHAIDDPYTTNILWPNFHSGANGDFQRIRVCGSVHPVLADADSPTGAIRFLPSHPHEGDVGVPPGEPARVVATGVSKTTGRPFNIAVAFESSARGGRAIAQSTFHHFADYNWNTAAGAPSFVTEPPSNGMQAVPQALQDTHRYALNVARWLTPEG
jgi:hypothetical protein